MTDDKQTGRDGQEVMRFGTPSARSNWSKHNQLDWAVWFWRAETGYTKASVFLGDTYIGQVAYEQGKAKPYTPIFHGVELKPSADIERAIMQLNKRLELYMKRGY